MPQHTTAPRSTAPHAVARRHTSLQNGPASDCPRLLNLVWQVLVDHLRVVSPSVFESRAVGPFAGVDSSTLFANGVLSGQGGMSIGHEEGRDANAAPKVLKRAPVKQPPAQLLTHSQCVRLISGILHKKVKEDTLADQRAKPHVRTPKFTRDHLMRHYGTKALAESHLRDLVHSVQHYAQADSALQPRFQVFGEMLGVIDGAPRTRARSPPTLNELCCGKRRTEHARCVRVPPLCGSRPHGLLVPTNVVLWLAACGRCARVGGLEG
jgi:hypothetical protein